MHHAQSESLQDEFGTTMPAMARLARASRSLLVLTFSASASRIRHGEMPRQEACWRRKVMRLGRCSRPDGGVELLLHVLLCHSGTA